jgi:hypothetical protein
MRLNRLGPNHCHADSDDYSPGSTFVGGDDGGDRVYNHFHSFGNGIDNTSSFNVSIEWSDVEAIIRTFFEKGHPEAVRLERARELALAVAGVAQNSN